MDKFLTNNVDKKSLTYIYKNSDLKKVRKGEVVVCEGDIDAVIYIILKGQVEVSKIILGRKKEILASLTSGDLFGEISFLSRAPRIASVVALAPTTLIVVDRSTFEGFNSTIQLLFYKYISSVSIERKDKTGAAEKKYEYKNKQFIAKAFLSFQEKSKDFQNSDLIKEIITKIPRLPIFALSLSTKLFEGNISPGEVADEVKQDPPLVGAILKTINSSYYSLDSQVSDLNHAIMLLGYNEVSQIVIAEGVKRTMPDTSEFKAMYDHSLIISHIVSILSTKLRIGKSSEISTIALLHEFGQLVTLLLKKNNKRMGTLFDLVDTSQMGKMLLKSWKLPENIWKTIEYQSYPQYSLPDKIPENVRTNVILLYLSQLCYDYLRGLKEDDLPMIFYYEYLASINLDIVPLAVFVNKIMIPFIDQRKNTLPTILHELLNSYRISIDNSRDRNSKNLVMPDINQGYIKN
ncbi:MAG: HDOD domain-containing protein [Desulfobacterales bacterium]|nr:HDOD domain-containing protein [Desulfobacterales bacterium]